jgi:hypothetical protein
MSGNGFVAYVSFIDNTLSANPDKLEIIINGVVLEPNTDFGTTINSVSAMTGVYADYYKVSPTTYNILNGSGNEVTMSIALKQLTDDTIVSPSINVNNETVWGKAVFTLGISDSAVFTVWPRAERPVNIQNNDTTYQDSTGYFYRVAGGNRYQLSIDGKIYRDTLSALSGDSSKGGIVDIVTRNPEINVVLNVNEMSLPTYAVGNTNNAWLQTNTDLATLLQNKTDNPMTIRVSLDEENDNLAVYKGHGIASTPAEIFQQGISNFANISDQLPVYSTNYQNTAQYLRHAMVVTEDYLEITLAPYNKDFKSNLVDVRDRFKTAQLRNSASTGSVGSVFTVPAVFGLPEALLMVERRIGGITTVIPDEQLTFQDLESTTSIRELSILETVPDVGSLYIISYIFTFKTGEVITRDYTLTAMNNPVPTENVAISCATDDTLDVYHAALKALPDYTGSSALVATTTIAEVKNTYYNISATTTFDGNITIVEDDVNTPIAATILGIPEEDIDLYTFSKYTLTIVNDLDLTIDNTNTVTGKLYYQINA